MPGITDVGGFWKTLREVDLSALAREADAPFHIAVLGRPGAGKSSLGRAMRFDAHTNTASLASVLGEYDLPLSEQDEARVMQADAAILLLDALGSDHAVEHAAFDVLRAHGVPMVVAYNRADQVVDTGGVLSSTGQWMPAQVVAIAATDRASLERALVPAVLRTLKGREVAIARALPLFRPAVVKQLIEETSFANAAYSFTTGLAEIVPLLDVPLNVGDMLMLTKNQGLMAFKIALAEGLSSNWRETVPQLAAVVGAGFLWRQLGRGLVGLVPAWGIVPKVGIAYAGTVVVGQAIYHWIETGENLKPAALRDTYQQAVEQGKEFARTLLRRREERKELAAARELAAKRARKGHCVNCGKRLPRGASWCAYCGTPVQGAARLPLAGPSGEEPREQAQAGANSGAPPEGT